MHMLDPEELLLVIIEMYFALEPYIKNISKWVGSRLPFQHMVAYEVSDCILRFIRTF